jgi:hypothetical protein
MLGARYLVRIRMLSARCLFIVSGIFVAACAGAINTGYPEVPTVSAKPGAPQIGLARVADSRASRVSGVANNTNLLAGPELNDYIERKFRERLANEGFAPVEALNPATAARPDDHKTILVTLQSASIGNVGTMFSDPQASIDIAVQVYSAGGRRIVFGHGYSGQHSEPLGRTTGTGMSAGRIIAAAADGAIDQAFTDPAFEQALR